jgi:O-antigen/teichoic acid export membrane protein
LEGSNLQKRAIRGLSWQVFGFTIQTIASLLFLMIMGRFVSPDSFGSYGILNVFIVFILMLTEFGFGAALIQREQYNQYHVNATFFATIFSALFAYVLIFLFSNLIADFYDYKFNAIELQSLGLLLLIKASGSVSRSLLVREMRFKNLTLVTILSSVIGNLLIGCPLAIYGYEIWAIIISILSVNVMLTIGFFIYKPINFGFAFRLKEFKDIFRFGGNLTLVRVFNQLGSQIDKLILGKFYPMTTIGFYERAGTISNMPKVYLGRVIDNVLFSTFSK